MKNRTILEVHQMLVNNEITISQLVKERIDIIENSVKDQSNAFLTVFKDECLAYAKKLENELKNNQDNLLFGIPGTIKDNINIKGYRTTGASQSLDNYISVYNAEVVSNLYDVKTIFLAKTNLDEFGFGGTGTYSGYGIVKNPLDSTRITGGSSSGSAVSVAIGAANFSIATDTGDSIRRPASFLGLVGYKPSYGVVSRYGVLPFSSTLDHVGIFGNDVTDIAIVLDAIAKFDKKDFTSIRLKETNFYKDLKLDSFRKLNLLVLDDVLTGLDKELKVHFDSLVSQLEKHHNVVHKNFGMDLLNIISPLYKAMAYSEGASNWNNLTGITFAGDQIKDYSNYVDLMYNLRTNKLCSQIKTRMVVGNWMTSVANFNDIYLQSRKIRHVIINKAKELMQGFDAVIIPGSSTVAFKLQDVLENKVSSNYCDDALQIANFSGLPSITIPFIRNSENLPFGINLFANKYEDKNLLNVALQIENFIKEGNF